MKTKTLAYLRDAISRIESGKVSSESGSHLVGIFSKAANGFEKHMKSYVETLLRRSGIDYEQDIRGPIKGPTFSKATLGYLIAAIKEASNLKPAVLPKLIPGKLSDFIATSQQVNEVWVHVKHGDEVGGDVILLRLKSMLSLLQQIDAAKSNDDV